MKRINFLLCLFLIFSGSAWADVVIIAHKNAPETTISQKSLQEIFLGKRVQWADNSTLHPATVKEDTLHKAFLKQYLKKSPSQWLAHWKRLVFTGNGTPPKQFAGQKELLDYVAKTSGAIGYIDDETPHENVIIIHIK